MVRLKHASCIRCVIIIITIAQIAWNFMCNVYASLIMSMWSVQSFPCCCDSLFNGNISNCIEIELCTYTYTCICMRYIRCIPIYGKYKTGDKYVVFLGGTWLRDCCQWLKKVLILKHICCMFPINPSLSLWIWHFLSNNSNFLLYRNYSMFVAEGKTWTTTVLELNGWMVVLIWDVTYAEQN